MKLKISESENIAYRYRSHRKRRYRKYKGTALDEEAEMARSRHGKRQPIAEIEK